MAFLEVIQKGISAIRDSAGSYVDIDSLPKTYGRDASGNVTTITATNGSNTWVKTYTRNGAGNVTAESAWVLQ